MCHVSFAFCCWVVFVRHLGCVVRHMLFVMGILIRWHRLFELLSPCDRLTFGKYVEEIIYTRYCEGLRPVPPMALALAGSGFMHFCGGFCMLGGNAFRGNPQRALLTL